MTEQSQMPLVGPPKRRGWREVVWFRPLTPSTHAALVVTRRGRLVSILPAGGPRVLSDYLAWPYDFREVDTRERSLVLDQRLESFDSNHEFSVALRLIYQVVQPDRVALDLEDVSTELSHAVVQSLRLSGRSFGVEQDKTFEEHLQETLITSDALVQRVQQLGLVLRRAEVTVSLDEPTRAHAESLRFVMRERPLHFQVAVESLEPERSFDVIIGGAYRLTDRRAAGGPSDTTDSAIQLAITRALRRVGITFAPSDYPDAAKAMADVLRKDSLLQSELSMVQALLLRPTVQIQPDRSMVHVPRPNLLPEPRPDPMLRRVRQSLPRMGRPPALTDTQDREPQQSPAPAARRALPPPEAQPADLPMRWALPLESQPEPPAEIAASQTLPLGDLPAQGDPSEGEYTRWPSPESMPVLRAQPQLGQPDDDVQDARAPWADLISAAEEQPTVSPWAATLPASEPVSEEQLPWDALAVDAIEQPLAETYEAPQSALLPAAESAPAEPQPWDSLAFDAATQPLSEAPAPSWLAAPPTTESELDAPQPWDSVAFDVATQSLSEAPAPPWSATLPASKHAPAEPQPWDSVALDAIEPPLLEEPAPPWLAAPPAPESEPVEVQPWDSVALDVAQPLPEAHEASWSATQPIAESEPVEAQPWDSVALDTAEPAMDEPAPVWASTPSVTEPEAVEAQPWDSVALDAAVQSPVEALETSSTATLSAIAPETIVPQPVDSSPTEDTNQPAIASAFAAEEPWSVLDTFAGAELADGLPGLVKSDPVDDLGFSLDWSEPELTAPLAEPPANTFAPDVSTPADDLGFSLDWSEPQDDSYASAWVPNTDTPADERIIMAHWEEPTVDVPAPAHFSNPLAEADDLTENVTADHDPASEVAEQDTAPAVIEQEAPPWYAPTLQLDDQLPFDMAADNSGYALFETQETAWAEPAVAPSALDDNLVADAFPQISSEPIEQASTATSEPERELLLVGEHEFTAAHEEPVAAVPSEEIARIIGMIQSYGPAWFKMWSLELKERPERLPVVLGEVTADPDLLAQAADPQVQSALLAALAAYSAPVTFPARRSVLAALPRPAIAGQGNDGEDEVPDWLSLRVKWNGHGGGA